MTAPIDRAEFDRLVLTPADELFVHASRVSNDDEEEVTAGDLADLRAMAATVGHGIDALDPTVERRREFAERIIATDKARDIKADG